MTSTVRRTVVRLSRDERMRDIVAAARKVFIERGFDAASTAEIAANAGVAEGTIYKYFESKRDVLLAVIEAWYRSMIGNYVEQLAGMRGARNKIYFIVWQHLKFITDDIEMCRLCFNEVRRGEDYYQTPIYEFNRRYTGVFLDVCREGIRDGELRKDLRATLFRDLVFGGIDARVSRLLFGAVETVFDAGVVTQEIVDLFYSGVGAGAPSTSPAVLACSEIEAIAGRLESAVTRVEQLVESRSKTPVAHPESPPRG